MLRGHINRMLDASAGRDPAATFAWLGGARLPLAGMLAHMVNELLIHGSDIARALNMGRVLKGSKRPVKRRWRPSTSSGSRRATALVIDKARLCGQSPASAGKESPCAGTLIT